MGESSYTAIASPGPPAVARVRREKVSELEAKVIENELLAAAEGASWKMAVDMSEVRFLTSAGIGTLVTLHKSCRAGGGKMAVFGLAPEIVELLRITKLDRVFTIAADRAAAVKAAT